MSDTALLILTTIGVALLLLGSIGAPLPRLFAGVTAAMLCGAGALTCLGALVSRAEPATLRLPAGPPDLPLSLGLDPVSTLFLFVILLCGGAVTAAAALGAGSARLGAAAALTLGGLSFVVLGDGPMILAIGLVAATAGLWACAPDQPPPAPLMAVVPVLLLLCLLAEAGNEPAFAVIRATPAEGRVIVATLLGLCAGAVLLAPLPPRHGLRGAVVAGGLLPAALYLLTRMLADLPGPDIPAWCGHVLMLGGGLASLAHGWQAAGHPDLDGAADALIRQHAALAAMGLGVAVIARVADLPEAAAFALAASILLMLSAAMAGTLAALAVAALAEGAGTWRLARLGGLMRTMPATAAVLAVALLALSALPPGAGFAGLWLMFQALLFGPRTGGLFTQVPIALAAACLAASFALAAAAALRIAGIALLGRARAARTAGAQDIAPAPRAVLSAFGALPVLIGLFPGLALHGLAQPAVKALSGISLGARAGWVALSATPANPGYATLPVLALVLFLTGGVILLTRRYRATPRLSAVWTDGQPPPPHLPFGDPMAQSAGTGFRPALPDLPVRPPHRPNLRLPGPRTVSPRTALWAMLLGLAALLLVTALIDAGGP